jgi:hypothetical protein
MITPSPTTKLDPGLARGVFNGSAAATATTPAHIVLSIPNTSYELYLAPNGEIRAEVGKRLVGTIRARSRRIDKVQTGGRYIEPVFGKARRIQGTVIGEAGGALIVNATVPFHITCGDARQKPGDFEIGDMVALDLPEWPTFTPA